MVCLDDVVKKVNVEYIGLDRSKLDEFSNILIEKVLEFYKERRGSIEIDILKDYGFE